MMKFDYDVVVIGAGPAGSMAARTAARYGSSVLLLEQKKVIGYPIHCAGGILTLILDQKGLVPVVKNAILTNIRAFQVHSPLGRTVTHQFNRTIGYVVDRTRFDQALCAAAQHHGVELLTHTRAVGLEPTRNAHHHILVKQHRDIHRISTKIIIAADGVASAVAQWAGLTIPREYLGIGYSYNATNIENLSPNTVEVFFLPSLPSGYAWIFPQGPHRANIGLGGYNSGTYMRQVFNWFRKKHPIAASKLSQASLDTYTGGIIPGSKIPPKTTFNYGMVVGDAANQVDSISGEGIRLALICGEIAGQIAAYAIHHNSLELIHRYHNTWLKRLRYELWASYLLRNLFFRFNANDLDVFVEAVSRTNLNLLFKKKRWALLFAQTISQTPHLLKLFGKIGLSLPPFVKPHLNEISKSFKSSVRQP